MVKNEMAEDEKDELLNWNENETFVTSEATSRVSDVDLLKVRLSTISVKGAVYIYILRGPMRPLGRCSTY